LTTVSRVVMAAFRDSTVTSGSQPGPRRWFVNKEKKFTKSLLIW